MNRSKTGDPAPARSQKWIGTWADVEQAQLESMLRATPAQRLAWLEEAMRLAYASGALGTDHDAPPSPPPGEPSANAKAAARLDVAADGRVLPTDLRGP